MIVLGSIRAIPTTGTFSKRLSPWTSGRRPLGKKEQQRKKKRRRKRKRRKKSAKKRLENLLRRLVRSTTPAAAPCRRSHRPRLDPRWGRLVGSLFRKLAGKGRPPRKEFLLAQNLCLQGLLSWKLGLRRTRARTMMTTMPGSRRHSLPQPLHR
eukprot:Rmarinus@m.14360